MINMNLLIYLFKDLYKQYRSKNIWTLVPYYMFKLIQGCVRVLLFMDSLKCAHKVLVVSKHEFREKLEFSLDEMPFLKKA